MDESAQAPFAQVSTPTQQQGEYKLLHADEPIKATRELYASVLVALMLPFQFGWSLSQLNLS
ncbi:Solute carrier family 2, partial [Globisporangium polare]